MGWYYSEPPVDTKMPGSKMKLQLTMDTAADLPNLPGIDEAAPSSVAFCLETSDAYMLNSAGDWVMI